MPLEIVARVDEVTHLEVIEIRLVNRQLIEVTPQHVGADRDRPTIGARDGESFSWRDRSPGLKRVWVGLGRIRLDLGGIRGRFLRRHLRSSKRGQVQQHCTRERTTRQFKPMDNRRSTGKTRQSQWRARSSAIGQTAQRRSTAVGLCPPRWRSQDVPDPCVGSRHEHAKLDVDSRFVNDGCQQSRQRFNWPGSCPRRCTRSSASSEDFDHLAWVVTGYLLAQTVVTPVATPINSCTWRP